VEENFTHLKISLRIDSFHLDLNFILFSFAIHGWYEAFTILQLGQHFLKIIVELTINLIDHFHSNFSKIKVAEIRI
jgi:hypothetical protein